MRKYIRAMFYGSSKTKMFLWMLVLAFFLSTIFAGACALGGGMVFAYVAFGGYIFTITFSQLATFRDSVKEIKQGEALTASIEKKNENRKKKIKLEDMENGLGGEFAHYTEEEIQKYLVQYKVKKENFRIVVDSSEEHKIKCCPAYTWSDKNFLYLLLLEKKPRMVNISRKKLANMSFIKGQVVRDIDEYSDVKNSILGKLYEESFPKYYKNTVNGLTTFMKNLFLVGDDLYITAPSAGSMIKAVQCRLVLTDKQIDRNRFNSYFEEVYKWNLLFKERSISAEEYEEKTRELLATLAEHEEDISVFQSTVMILRQYNMISQEYAEFYMKYRQELDDKRKERK